MQFNLLYLHFIAGLKYIRQQDYLQFVSQLWSPTK